MIVEDGECANVNGEYFSQRQNPLFNPTSSMFKRLACVVVFPTKKRSAYTAADTMVIRG